MFLWRPCIPSYLDIYATMITVDGGNILLSNGVWGYTHRAGILQIFKGQWLRQKPNMASPLSTQTAGSQLKI